MRITNLIRTLGAAALMVVAGCTVKDVDQPPLAGPSTFALSITAKASPDVLIQDGASQSVITITALDQNGTPRNIPLRAEIIVDNTVQDFGRLSTKQPTANGAPLIYTSPAPSTIPAGQVGQTVTIAVTPTDGGNFRGEFGRQVVDIRLVPLGIIQPSNPNLFAAFTFSPAAPQVMSTVAFDASTTTNNGVACGVACTYSWNFGDGTGSSGINTTHQFRTINTFAVTLTVTDVRGATDTATQTVVVAAGTPPGAAFTISPAAPGVNQDVFFDATASRPAAGRTITNYDWSFGDGSTGTGVVTSHSYSAPGVYQLSLTTTDDAGTKSTSFTGPSSITVGPTVGPEPVARMTCTGGNSTRGTPVNCNASASTPGSGSNIVSYTFNWGVGAGDEVHTNPVQSHLYTSPGTFTVTLTVRDSLGRTSVVQTPVTVVATP
jgi:PKD repeat protein